MQLTSTTDYAIRIISYLTEKNGSASANELSDELNIPNSYIPKIIKNLKNNIDKSLLLIYNNLRCLRQLLDSSRMH